MGFDNLGNVFHEDEPFRRENALQFGTRDVVHLILDFSDSSRWRLYAKVGDLDEEDYEDLMAAEQTKKLTSVFDHVQPGSYRLAVSLFSFMDALIIENCKIHGVEDAEFYQELKQYALTEDAKSDEPIKVQTPMEEQTPVVEEQPVSETAVKSEKVDDGKEIETEEDEPVESKQSDESKKEETVTQTPQSVQGDGAVETEDTADSTVPPWTSNNVGANTVVFKPTVHRNSISPSPNLMSPLDEGQHDEYSTGTNSNATMQQIETAKSVEIHSPATPDTAHSGKSPAVQHVDRKQLEEQSKIIESLKQQIDELKRENEDKQREIDNAAERERQHQESMKSMQTQLDSLRGDAGSAEEKYSAMEEENKRLSHELSLAQQRAESLETADEKLKERLKNVIESKLQLIISTSEEIDHYRKLIQQIAQNKLGCQLLSDFAKYDAPSNHNGYRYNGRRPMRPQNGYY